MKKLKSLKLGFKILAGLLVVALAFSIIMPITSKAYSESTNYEYYLQDINQLLTKEQTDALEKSMQDAANAAQCIVDIYIVDSLDGYYLDGYPDVNGYAQDVIKPLMNGSIGEIALVYYVETLENGDVKRDSEILCNDKVPAPYNEIASEITPGKIYTSAMLDGDYAALNKFCQTIIAHNPPVNTEYKNSDDDNLVIKGNEWKAALADYDDCLTDSEEEKVLNRMVSAAEKAECNIGLVITRDLNGKTHIKYTEKFEEDCFGFYSDSISLLLLNRHGNPKYESYKDWISTDGTGRDKFDKYTQQIFDRIYDALGDKPNENFYAAAMAYCEAVENYATSIVYKSRFLGIIAQNPVILVPALAIALLISFVITLSISRKYKKKAPISATRYIDRRTVRVTWTRDDFIREYTTSVRVESSSHRSGGGHHGGGGGGGHHGGGGGRGR